MESKRKPGMFLRFIGWTARTVRATVVALNEALSGSAVGTYSTVDPGEYGWRPLTERVAGKEYRRDLTPLSQQQMQRIAHYLYTGNALAQFLINIPVAITVGRSVSYTLEFDHERLAKTQGFAGFDREQANELAQQAREYLDKFWEHPAHDFKGRAARYARTYLLTGELLLVIPQAPAGSAPDAPSPGVNDVTGLFMLDYIDSTLIGDVQGKNGLATTPGRVLVKQTSGDPVGFDVMLPDVYGTYTGECFFFRHAGRLNALRGLSYIVAQADWIDLYDQILYARGDKALLANTLVYDLKVTGAQDDTAVQNEVKKLASVIGKPGGIHGHNDKIELNVRTADLKETDSDNLIRRLLLHILGSKGIPEHWFADAGSTNRASSGEQSQTALKVLEELQEEFLGIFAVPLTVAYDRLAEKQRVFPPRSSGAVRLYPNLPKLSERDITVVGNIAQGVENALDTAVMAGRLSKRTAQRVTLTLVEKITGEHADADEEQAQIDLEVADAAKVEQQQANDRMKAAQDLAKQLGADPKALAALTGDTPSPEDVPATKAAA